jgi:hypothetical protein
MQNNHFPRQARDKVNCFQLNTTQQTAFCAGCNGREAIGRSSGSHHRGGSVQALRLLLLLLLLLLLVVAVAGLCA